MAEIRAMTDKEAAVVAATGLVTEAAAFRGEAAELRTELAREWKRSEHLTLKQMAERLEIRLGTVQKLLERDKRAERDRDKKRAGRRPPEVP
jgi:hypothetical protein